MGQNMQLAEEILKRQDAILKDWMAYQVSALTLRRDLVKESELRETSRQFLELFSEAFGVSTDTSSPNWKPVKDSLAEISQKRAVQGFSSSETATFVFSLKQPLFDLAQQRFGQDGKRLADTLWDLTRLLDHLGLYTTEVYQESREGVISRQQQELMELSTPVVQLWDEVLALPLIGTLDSARTQVVMENLLQRVVETGARIAIVDITGVPTVDTLVAQHLMKTVAATRLMGADCIISGIRPQIAQTIVHLGVNLNDIITKATLADAFQVALQRLGATVTKAAPTTESRQVITQLTQTEKRMERIPILKMGPYLLVTIQVDMHDRVAMTLQDELTQRIVSERARGVLLDISSVDVVDSFIGRMIGNIASMSRVLDAETVVVGMRPAVAITLVELGLALPNIRTALNVDAGMTLLKSARKMSGNGRPAR
jgi:rsbT co-antagonist protein RsbR